MRLEAQTRWVIPRQVRPGGKPGPLASAPRLLSCSFGRPAGLLVVSAPPPSPRMVLAPHLLLPALGGKVVNSSACTLRNPTKSAQQPLSSRIVVHLIGCSAAPSPPPPSCVKPAAGAPCLFSKAWYCKDPQGLPPVLFYRCGNEPREGKRLMFHQLMEKPGLEPRGITLSSAPAATKRGRNQVCIRCSLAYRTGRRRVVLSFVFLNLGVPLSPPCLHPPSRWPFCPSPLLLALSCPNCLL